MVKRISAQCASLGKASVVFCMLLPHTEAKHNSTHFLTRVKQPVFLGPPRTEPRPWPLLNGYLFFLYFIHTLCCPNLRILSLFIFLYFKDKTHQYLHLVGGCWVQMGYNFLYGLWKYSWDADCDLFLRILKGEVKEDVYLEQIQLQVIPLSLLIPVPPRLS
jgi:hypothetical protein